MKASVILVTWSDTEERLKLLKETLDSFRKSTDVPYELIVIDNGVRQQTEFLKTQKIDNHVINESNRGIGFGRNQGVELATGDYIVFIDNDLLFAKDWLKEGIDLLEKYPDKKLVVTTCVSSHHSQHKYFRGKCGENFLWSRSCPAGNIFRRKDIDEIGVLPIHARPGTEYCNIISAKKYLFISLMFPKVVHRGIFSSYDHKKLMKGGEWKKEWGL